MAFVNQAAWIKSEKAYPLEIGPGPDQNTIEEDEVIIKVSHVAINPSEWKLQSYGIIPLPYPTILGSDVAGEIVKVNPNSKFKVGDRVIAHCLGLSLGSAKHAGFQTYTTCKEIVVAKIPDTLGFEKAVVLPLSISTAATGLYQALNLELPASSSKGKGNVVVWGGSSSCGGSAIQLAAAAGYEVVTTASPHNHEYVKSLGAAHVFDHGDPEVVDKINSLVASDLVGVLDSISDEKTQRSCADIVRKNGGGKLAILMPPNVEADGVEMVMVIATDPGLTNKKLGEAIWGQYIPQALANGTFQAKPEPIVIDGGLQKVQEAIDLQQKGVSAKKVVVKL